MNHWSYHSGPSPLQNVAKDMEKTANISDFYIWINTSLRKIFWVIFAKLLHDSSVICYALEDLGLQIWRSTGCMSEQNANSNEISFHFKPQFKHAWLFQLFVNRNRQINTWRHWKSAIWRKTSSNWKQFEFDVDGKTFSVRSTYQSSSVVYPNSNL